MHLLSLVIIIIVVCHGNCSLTIVAYLILNTDLTSVVGASYTPTPSVTQVSQVWDIHSWLKPYIPPLHDHLKAYQFKIVKKLSGALLFYKQWSTDDYWLPDGGLKLLVAHNGQYYPPMDEVPQVIHPAIDAEEHDSLHTMALKLKAYLAHSGKFNWWMEWLKNSAANTSTTSDDGE